MVGFVQTRQLVQGVVTPECEAGRGEESNQEQ